ncbi:M16 family metallopeptidase [Sphingosinicella rhizophila]|nr:pitrilysin family protein [Sphingosinicella sp. GR2756]
MLPGPTHAEPHNALPAIPRVPPLDYTARTLANGARVYAISDESASTVSINVWYQVGQRDDPPGRGGFAHLFEHLMFQSTRNLPDGVSKFVTSIGGSTNASTLFDYTDYYISAPANQLEALIWLEGERLRNLVIDEAGFKAERDVVKEELRQRIFAQPYGRILYMLLPGFTFSTHPYVRPIGSSIADLDRAQLADVRAFHETYYRPDNAIFVISGNFEEAKMNAWVDAYLGSIARPDRPIPRDTADEGERMAPVTVEAYAPNVPLPAIIFSWRAPEAADADAAGLALIEAVLTRGPSARLRRVLVDQKQLASNIVSYNLPARDGYAFALVATLAQGADIAAAEAALAEEIVRLRDTPISEAELAAVKNGMFGDALSRRERPVDRAFQLGGGVALTGDPRLEDRRLEAIRLMKAGDVQKVAARWLADRRRVTIHYQDESRRPPGYTGDVPQADIAKMGPSVKPPSRPAVTIATIAERQWPPAPSAVVQRTPPVLADHRLANGLRVIVAKSSDVPIATLKLVIDGGDASDPDGRAGLADLLADVAVRGAGDRDAAAMAEAMAGLGASIDASVEADSTQFTIQTPAANAEAAGGLLADIVLRPTLAVEELERVRRQQIDALAVAGRQPMQTALRLVAPTLFPDAAYGQVPRKTSLEAVGREDLAASRATLWRPDRATLLITGGIDAETGFALAGRLFGDWRSSGPAPAIARRAGPMAAPRILAVDIPGAGQAALLAAVPTVGRGDAVWPALRVANARLGGGSQGFLSQEIRVKRGLSYGAGSMIDARRDATLVMAATQTKNESAVEVAGLVLDQLRRLASEPVDDTQVEERWSHLTNMLASQTERSAGLAAYLASLLTAGISLEVATSELLGQEPASPAQVLAAAQHLTPEKTTLIIVGDARKWLPSMRRQYPGLKLVTAEGVAVEQDVDSGSGPSGQE